jgi:hypothetical protein
MRPATPTTGNQGLKTMQVRPVLSNAIEVVRKRIQQNRDRKEILGEQNTKAALIDPILVALGWDLQEIDEVRREFRRKAGRTIPSITLCS